MTKKKTTRRKSRRKETKADVARRLRECMAELEDQRLLRARVQQELRAKLAAIGHAEDEMLEAVRTLEATLRAAAVHVRGALVAIQTARGPA